MTGRADGCDLKSAIKISRALCLLAALCLLSGCGTVRVSPWWFSHEISATDRVVVTNTLAGSPSPRGLPPIPSLNYSLTLTGADAREIVHAISTMRTEVDLSGQTESTMFYEWRLNFYHRKKLLGEVAMSDELIECGDSEYPTPPVLKKLYDRIQRESGDLPAR